MDPERRKVLIGRMVIVAFALLLSLYLVPLLVSQMGWIND